MIEGVESQDKEDGVGEIWCVFLHGVVSDTLEPVECEAETPK